MHPKGRSPFCPWGAGVSGTECASEAGRHGDSEGIEKVPTMGMTETTTTATATATAYEALVRRAAAADEAPGDGWVLLDAWMTGAGLDAGDVARVAGWVADGQLSALSWQGQVYLPRVVWGSPPPGYVTVREWAARQEISDSYAYLLLEQGRVRPAWCGQMETYRHWYVATWAPLDTREAA